ncbi:hypothetical protein [Mycobacteroides abscessus]|uniref:hypothetical protein n=1 Tax=Mycobacteroides abscessus TaxID=36809 RepID=UPI000C25E046|nr:hypothetical protein [Mycobacteroides abscessus]
MRIEIIPTGWQHSITGDEIRNVITHPLLRYAITTAHPDADTYMFIGNTDNQPWIEVAAENEDEEAWVVFHAMILTPRVAREIHEITGGLVDLRDQLSPQRPHVGPQFNREEN